jgi:hypothetical protein
MANSIRKAVENLSRLKKGKKDLKQEHQVYKPYGKPIQTNDFVLDKTIFWKLFKKHMPKDYQVTLENEQVLFTIFKYFLKDESFNEFGLINNKPSLDKGILLYGDYGVGKTQLFSTLHLVGKELATKVNCTDIWFNCISAGSFVDQYMESTKDPSSTFQLKKFYKGKLYIDDLGFEKKAFNKTEIFGELLFERYRNFTEETRLYSKGERKNIITQTFVTTNHKPSEIANRYGERIGDRLPEMFNIIPWRGESFRE